jgi:hypothetical protein
MREPRMSRPLRSAPTASSRGFTATTGRSACPPRIGTRPLAFQTLGDLPLAALPGGQYRGALSHVPHESRRPGSRRLHAGHHLASRRAPARLFPGQKVTPGSDAALSNNDASTANPVTGAFNATSPWSPPDASRAPFPSRSPQQSSAYAADGGLKPPPAGRLRRASNPSSPVQHRVRSPCYIRQPPALVAHLFSGTRFPS